MTLRAPPRSTRFPYTTLFRSLVAQEDRLVHLRGKALREHAASEPSTYDQSVEHGTFPSARTAAGRLDWSASAMSFDIADRKSTRLNSSHSSTSYAVFCSKKKRPAVGRALAADRDRHPRARPRSEYAAGRARRRDPRARPDPARAPRPPRPRRRAPAPSPP